MNGLGPLLRDFVSVKLTFSNLTSAVRNPESLAGNIGTVNSLSSGKDYVGSGKV